MVRDGDQAEEGGAGAEKAAPPGLYCQLLINYKVLIATLQVQEQVLKRLMAKIQAQQVKELEAMFDRYHTFPSTADGALCNNNLQRKQRTEVSPSQGLCRGHQGHQERQEPQVQGRKGQPTLGEKVQQHQGLY